MKLILTDNSYSDVDIKFHVADDRSDMSSVLLNQHKCIGMTLSNVYYFVCLVVTTEATTDDICHSLVSIHIMSAMCGCITNVLYSATSLASMSAVTR